MGAGRGDLKAIFSLQGFPGAGYLPITETDLSVDLIEVSRIKPAYLDLIVIANVHEHVYDTGN